ncbi:MAG: molecular chaperone SurA [Betaproteobacteria bacterium]|nr:molecular chaperone SurA [Betaproteobacteria bacterium]
MKASARPWSSWSRGLLAAVLWANLATTAQAQASRARITLIDRIVAIVNNEVITQNELAQTVQQALDELRRRGTPIPQRQDLEKQVLDRLITERVQLQFAKETSTRVDELDLDRTIGRIAEGNNLSLAEFRIRLENDGLTFSKFREDLRKEILIERIRDREVDSKINIADSEIENYLAENKDAAETKGEIRLGHILVRVPEQASPDQLARLRARAQEVVEKIKQNGDFAQLAATYSDAPDGLQGGDMGWRGQDRLPELFAEAVAKLKTGEQSAVLRSPAGFHILRVTERRGGAAPLLVEQNRIRHILVRINELTSEDEAKRKLALLRDRIVNGTDFAELARLQSEDSSASRGGDLGWIVPGDTLPEFERAFKELKIMEVSATVKTQFGLHLIQVLERRTSDVSSDRERLEARKILRERKSDEAYQDWLRQIRDRAYVEYRTEDR